MKKNLHLLFVVSILFFITQACDYVPNRSNIIASSRDVIDTGVRYIVVERDTSHLNIPAKPDSVLVKKPDSLLVAKKPDSIPPPAKPIVKVEATINAKAEALVNYAKTFVGKPYVYGVNTPEKGFDNAGFVNFVFSHFEIKLPKYPPAFIAVGESVAPGDVSEGDIVLFAKTDSVKKAVYQVGIVVSAKGSPISFIQASSGKMNGVGISTLSSYYQRKVMGYRRMF
jgi:cell wall-associated NlpC family hydrolase|nr:NlpC/P60 family protein [uncultured Pedobacter sp.]